MGGLRPLHLFASDSDDQAGKLLYPCSHRVGAHSFFPPVALGVDYWEGKLLYPCLQTVGAPHLAKNKQYVGHPAFVLGRT